MTADEEPRGEPSVAPDIAVPGAVAAAQFGALARRPPGLFSYKSLADQIGLAVLPRDLDSLIGYKKLAEQMGVAASLHLSRLIHDQLRLTDFITPASLRSFELTATSRIAELLGTSTALATWRNSLLMDDAVQRLIRSQTALSVKVIDLRLLDNLGRVAAGFVDLAAWAAAASPGSALLRGFSAPSIATYHGYVTSLASTPTRPQLDLSVAAGHGVSALVGTELLTGELDEEQNAQGTDRVERHVVSPWQHAPYAARAELLIVLQRVDPSVPELLSGAWDDVSRQGPAALVKIATCAVEALDRSLRAVVPRDSAEVLAWLEAGKTTGLISDGRATRAGQIRYLLRNRAGDSKLVERQVDSLIALANELIGRIQAAKHRSNGDVTSVCAHLVAVEAVLHQLFLVDR